MKDDKLWKIFSVYIRLRDADENGYCICCTSGMPVHWKDCDAGHFIGRRYMSTKYDERNVHSQRRFSNRFNGGEQYAHAMFIEKKYGRGTVDKLMILSRTRKSYSKFEIDALSQHYKKEVERLKKEKGL